MAVLSFNLGHGSKVRPGDLVGAITGESGITSRQLGAIRITARAALVEVQAKVAGRVMKALKGKTIRGVPVDVRVVDHAT